MIEAGKTAREEVKVLVEQIQEAAKAGDTDTVKSLQEQLKTTRQENIKERNAAVEQLNGYRKELCSDIGGARKDAGLPPVQRPPAKEDSGNPQGFNPPDNRRLPPPSADKKEGVVDRREDIRDRREDVADHREDVKDRREDIGGGRGSARSEGRPGAGNYGQGPQGGHRDGGNNPGA